MHAYIRMYIHAHTNTRMHAYVHTGRERFKEET